MKRCLAGWLTLFLLFAAVSGFALTYSVDPATGLYVDESGEVIAEYWDEGAGIYIVDGVAYPISNSDGGSASSGAAASEPVQNPDGGMEVTSSDQTGAFDSNAAAAAAQQGEEDGSTTGSAGLTPEEWRARMDKAMQANGVSTGTVYVDENGTATPVEVSYVGLGRSEVILNGVAVMVPPVKALWIFWLPSRPAPRYFMYSFLPPTPPAPG